MAWEHARHAKLIATIAAVKISVLNAQKACTSRCALTMVTASVITLIIGTIIIPGTASASMIFQLRIIDASTVTWPSKVVSETNARRLEN